MMKSKLFLILFLASLLAVMLIPGSTVLAASQAPAAEVQPAADIQPAAENQPAPDALGQQPPAVHVVIGLVAALFGCLAFAPLALSERLAINASQESRFIG